MLNKTIVNNHLNDVGTIMHDLNITDKPKQLWNTDETDKRYEHDPVRVVVHKGYKNLHRRTTNKRQIQLSLRKYKLKGYGPYNC